VIRLAVRCRPRDAERVLAELLELVPGGVEEEHGGDWVEFGIYGPPGELPALPALEATAGEQLIEISSTEIPDDWADRGRDFHEAVSVARGRLVVRPSWEDAAGARAQVDIRIDQGQAFGTGAHATTSMCLELLLELADGGEARGPLVDLGTGSGVLAIAAAKLGWAPVTGCDSEQAAVEAAAENAAANDVEVELVRLNLRDERPPAAPTVVANLTAPLLELVAAKLPGPPQVLVCSGLLATEVERVSEALRSGGMKVAELRTRGDWAALLARADPPAGADRVGA